MNFRTTGLGAAVLLAVLLPVTAVAGPATGPGREAAGSPMAPSAPSGGAAVLSGTRASTVTAVAPPRASARCGPEGSSPDGVEAQTCVMTRRGVRGARSVTWARTYYRNATGVQLDAVVVMLAPGGRTVEMHCGLGTEDEPALCETPREPVRGRPAGYAAVAEFARAGDGGDTRMLLRSGSNSPVSAGH
ncbi:hypothetical protein [Streptomyces sp. NBC_00344]|uniref:hypothetical protein n=1 Tax=Streptomyces sp. NBC_00344 TaxID=2975720 RepID=UPI002E1E2EF3